MKHDHDKGLLAPLTLYALMVALSIFLIVALFSDWPRFLHPVRQQFPPTNKTSQQ